MTGVTALPGTIGPAPELPARVSTLLVGLDGALVETSYLHTVAWFLAFDEAGHRQPMRAIHPLVGTGGDDLVTELLGGPSEDVTASHDRRFADYLPSVRALPGAKDLLDQGSAAGLRMCIVTSSNDDVLDGLLAPLGGSDAVDDVVHSGMAARSMPHPDLFEVALDRAGVPASEALAVGGAPCDIAAASAAGIACVGLRSGGSTRRSLAAAGAVGVFADARELVEDWSS